MKFRNKPRVIEAEQFTDTHTPKGVFQDSFYSDPRDIGGRRLITWHYTVTIHGQKAKVVHGDWIITEPDGEHHYPCKPDVFEKTYELAEG